MRLLLLCALTILSPAVAAADDNEQHDSCPFPDSPSSSSDDSDTDYEESCSWDDDDDDYSFGGRGDAPVADLSWLSIRLAAAFGSIGLEHASFSDPTNTVHASGADIALGDAQFFGGELAFEFIPVEPLRLSLGVGGYGGVGGQYGGQMPDGRFGAGARSEGLMLIGFFAEAGIVQSLGPVQLVAALHLGVLLADVGVRSDCGCEGELEAARWVVGPQIGLRTHIWESVFLQGAVRFDATELPDHVTSLSIGLAPQP